jgi:hypothetical protein
METILMTKMRDVVEGILVCAIATVCAVLIVNSGMLLGLQVKGDVEVVSVVHSNTITSFTIIYFKDGGSYEFYGNENIDVGNHSFQAHYGWWDQLILDAYS